MNNTQATFESKLLDRLNIFIGFIYAAVIGSTFTTLSNLRPTEFTWIFSFGIAILILASNWAYRFLPFHYLILIREKQLSGRNIMVKFGLELFSIITLALAVVVWSYGISKMSNNTLHIVGNDFCFSTYPNLIRLTLGPFFILTFLWNHLFLYLYADNFKKYVEQITNAILYADKYEEDIKTEIDAISTLEKSVKEYGGKLGVFFLKPLGILFIHYGIWHVFFLNFWWGISLVLRYWFDGLPIILNRFLEEWILKVGWIIPILVGIAIFFLLNVKKWRIKYIILLILYFGTAFYTSILSLKYLTWVALSSQVVVGTLGIIFIVYSSDKGNPIKKRSLTTNSPESNLVGSS
jgi:hypothetical protein